VADAGKVDPPITSSDFRAAVNAAKGRAEELYRRVLFVGPDGRSSNAYVEVIIKFSFVIFIFKKLKKETRLPFVF
jgi:hypothetical protein